MVCDVAWDGGGGGVRDVSGEEWGVCEGESLRRIVFCHVCNQGVGVPGHICNQGVGVPGHICN